MRLSFYFQNVTYESLDDIYCSVPGVTPSALMTVSSLQLDVGCPVVIAAAIPDACCFQLTNVVYRRFPSLYTTA